MRFRAF